MMQTAIVAVCVAWAAWFALRRYLPAGLRRRLAAWCAQALRRMGFQSWAGRLTFVAAGNAAACASDGCGSCGSCASGQEKGRPAVVPISIHRRSHYGGEQGGEAG